MVRIKSFEFNLRELAGSMGDFGTLFPLAVGYIVVCGLDPTGLLIMMGIANIVTGLIYKIPMPIEPMKVLAVMAIAQGWSPSMVYASGFAMGIVWLFLSFTNIIGFIAKITPGSVVRGIQVSLGVLLAVQAVKMVEGAWVLAIACVLIVIFLKDSRRAPASLVLMAVGVAVIWWRGNMTGVVSFGLTLPTITTFNPGQALDTLVAAGFAQIPLTVTNAVIATAALIKTYFPDHPVTERRLALNMGVMNTVFPLFGGMPLCHGCGGLAGQYYFGARTGGANILEGTIEILLGLFCAAFIGRVFGVFPGAVIGAMMFLVGLEMVKFARDIRLNGDLFVLCLTVIVSLVSNMAVGFIVGVLAQTLVDSSRKRHQIRE